MRPPLLLLTRPEAQSRAFARDLATDPMAPPHEALVAPLSEIVARSWDRALAEGIAGVILTSANAVPHVAPLAPLPAWCVGTATARAAEAAGFAARASGGDAEALIADLRREGAKGPLLHAHGLHLARDLAGALAGEGLEIRAAAVYEARPLPWPDDLPARLMGRQVVAPLFSPRAAAGFAERLPRGLPGLRLICISANAAARLTPALAARAVTLDNHARIRAAVLAELSHPEGQP